MKERIIQLLTKEGLSATRFADMIGVQRSSISHILSGRNKPSFDFIEKTLLKLPDISAEWLILGKGTMYKEDLKEKRDVNTIEGLSDKNITQTDMFDRQSSNKPIPENDQTSQNKAETKRVTNVNNKHLLKIVLFYDDKSFSEYYPE